MLVLTRKQDGTIKIGNDIVIKVIKTGRSTVKIGIEAPSDVHILRGELESLGGLECVASTALGHVESMESEDLDLLVLQH